MTTGSEKRARSKHLTIRLTPDERAKIDADAERAGLTAGSHARQVLLGAKTPRQVRRPPVERQELARLLGSLGHVGGNLNQLAHRFNSGLPTDRQEVLEAIRSLNPVRDAVLRALGRDP
jgi:Bacterial mobilisation protein (MobC)